MIYKKETMAYNVNQQALSLYNYLHKYDDRFTLDGDNTSVDFNGIFKVKIASNFAYTCPHWIIQCSDANQTTYDTQPTTPYGQYWNEYWYLNTIFVNSENFIFFLAWPYAGRGPSPEQSGIGFSYIKTEDNKHYAQTLNPGTPNIDGRPYYNVVTGANVTFTLSPFINFSVPIEEIYTADSCILLAPSTNEISTVPNFISCSTVAIDKILTLNGKNYYSAGAHTLVPLEEDS